MVNHVESNLVSAARLYNQHPSQDMLAKRTCMARDMSKKMAVLA